MKTHSSVTRVVLAILLAGAAAGPISGCVHETTGGFTEKASPEKALEYRLELARKYIGDGNWEDAKRNLRQAQEIDPSAAEVHEAFALVYQSTGEFELAEASFQQAISHDLGFSRARNNYAAFLAQQGRYVEAEDQLEVVVEDTLYSARPQAFVNLGLTRIQLGDAAGAEEALVRALSMDRTSSLAMLELAQLRYDSGDYRMAQRYYDRYLSVVRRQSPRSLLLGVRLARRSGDRDAEGSYGMALRNLYPESPEYKVYREITPGG